MKLSLSVFLCASVACASAFVSPPVPTSTAKVTDVFSSSVPTTANAIINTRLCMSSSTITSEDGGVPVVINGQNIELTPALIEHVNKRIGGQLNKLASGGAVTACDVILSVSKNPKVKDGHRVEVVTNVKGMTFVCNNESPDMYASIDSASHALYRKLSKYKDNRIAGWHSGQDMGQDIMEALEAMEDVSEVDASAEDAADDLVDPDAPTVTKVKSFDLDNAMSVEEAVFALDYVDHDFFVFRNSETKEVSVVYKRNIGGVGLVEP